MVSDFSNEKKLFDAWLKDVKARHDQQSNHIKVFFSSKKFF